MKYNYNDPKFREIVDAQLEGRATQEEINNAVEEWKTEQEQEQRRINIRKLNALIDLDLQAIFAGI